MQYSQKQLPDHSKLLYAWFSAMFTRIDVLIHAEDSRDELVAVAEKIETEVKRIESYADRFNDTSELSRINKMAFDEEILVSEELFTIIDDCMLFNQKTEGCFDITVNSLNDFRFGLANIRLNSKTKSIRFLHSDVQLDLSGFIKGYSLRRVREILMQERIENALVNVGNSSILAMGSHPNGKGWKISSPEVQSANECILYDECLTTSGNSNQSKWPTVHPSSGEIIARLLPVSVVTKDPAIGEVLSTALYVVGAMEKERFLKQFEAKEMDW